MSIVTHQTTKDPNTGKDVVFVRGIERGMIFWADVQVRETRGSEQHSQRPWLIVSHVSIHGRMPIVQAVPLSSQLAKEERFRNHRIRIPEKDILPITGSTGQPLSGDSLALTEQLRVLSHHRLIGEPPARVAAVSLYSIEAGIRHVLGL